MDSKYSYSYTGNEIYCYPGTDVLRNKKNIRDSKRLMLFERTMTSLRQRELLVEPVADNLIKNDLIACEPKIVHDVLLKMFDKEFSPEECKNISDEITKGLSC